MKKLILIIAILFSVNGYSQHKVYPKQYVRNDTTFYSRKGVWYERVFIDKPIDDSVSWVKFDTNIVNIKKQEKKRRSKNRLINGIGFGLFIIVNIFAGITMSK